MNNFKRATVIILITFALISCIIALFPLMESTANGDANDDPFIVVSLGDSYSSGEGIEPFYDQKFPWNEKIDKQGWLAHRSEDGWPGLIEIETNNTTIRLKDIYTEDIHSTKPYRWYFVASSGAITDNITYWPAGRQKKTVRRSFFEESTDKYVDPQLLIFHSLPKGSVDYVTITIGGNDVEFAEILKLCITKDAFIDFGWLTGADNLIKKLSSLWNNIDEIKTKLINCYERIEIAAGKQATIIVAGYPQLVRGNNTIITPIEADIINDSVSDFNKVIAETIEHCRTKLNMNIYFVDDVEGVFKGHQANLANSHYNPLNRDWINPLILGPRAQDLDQTALFSNYSFHPNNYGAIAYADCVSKMINKLEDEKKKSTPEPTSIEVPPTPAITGTQVPTDAPTPQITPEDTYTPGPTTDPNPTSSTTSLEFELNDSGGYTVWASDSFNDKTIVIPRSYNGKPVTEIGSLAFCECLSLTSIEIPDTVILIGDQAFYGCENLSSISIPNSVTDIGFFVFGDCKALVSIDLPDGLTCIDNMMFHNCVRLKDVLLPPALTKIGYSAFSECTSITNINIPSNVSEIGDSAFRNCSSLKSISIPEGVSKIVESTFYGCSSLKTVYLPKSLTTIRGTSFENCTNLESIFYNGTFQDWNSISKMGWDGFDRPYLWDYNSGDYTVYCTDSEIDDFIVYSLDADLGTYSVIGYQQAWDYVYDSELDHWTIEMVQSSIGLVIPAYYRNKAVTSIHDYAFGYNDRITSVSIGKNVKSIGEGAFQCCGNMSSIVFEGDSLSTINYHAFFACEKVTKITIPNGVKDICSDAFAYCTSLSEVTIPASVDKIYSNSFAYCSELTTINYAGSIREWNAIDKYVDTSPEQNSWDHETGIYVIHCTDGDITK